MRVKLYNVERNVFLKLSQDKSICYGYVGKAWFIWNPARYELPRIKIPNKDLKGNRLVSAQRLIKMFLIKYRDLLLAMKGKSPMHFTAMTEEEKEDARQSTQQSEYNPHVSGIPKWLSERKTVVLCSGPKRTYKARRRFDGEELQRLAKEWLPHCSVCQLREQCAGPCKDREVSKQINIISLEEAILC